MSRDGGEVQRGYRPCVAMVVFGPDGRVLVAERNDLQEAAWQLPQGGMDEGETVRSAAQRELREEIGTDAVEYLSEAAGWIAYDLPGDLVANPWQGRFRGQRVKLVAFRLTGSDADIDLDAENREFRAWKWVELETLPGLIVSFKKPLYEAAVREFSRLRDSLR